MPYSHGLPVYGRRGENAGNSWRLAMYERLYQDANTNRIHEARPTRPFENAKIFTVPELLREVRPAAYHPYILAMGPYHSNRETAEIAECKIISAKQRINPKFQKLHNYVHQDIAKFTKMYDKKLEVEPEDLSLMLALDASLLSDIISEYALRHYPLQLPNVVYDNYVLPRRHFWTILRDLMLMENQIPMEILKEFKVGREGSGREGRERDFINDVYNLITYAYPFKKVEGRPSFNRPDFNDCHHLLEYFYRSCTQRYERDEKAENSDVQIPTISQLRAAGIRFRPLKKPLEAVRRGGDTIADPPKIDVGDLGRITFEDRTLWLPVLKMYSESEAWFRNLMAYEQCRNDLCVSWCSYMRLMGCLIETPEDVKHLTDREMLLNLMGSNEAVANVWNSFGVNVELFLTQRDKEIMQRINEHRKCKRKVRLAEAHHKYFSRPWSVISFLAAFFLLAMALLQVIYTIVTHVRHH